MRRMLYAVGSKVTKAWNKVEFSASQGKSLLWLFLFVLFPSEYPQHP